MISITLEQIEAFYQPVEQIVDELGAVDRQLKDLEATKSKLKAKLLERGTGFHKGAQYVAEVQEYDRDQISAPLVRQLSDEAFIKAVTTVQHVKAVVVKPLEAEQ
jgi:phage-related minor tail protein